MKLKILDKVKCRNGSIGIVEDIEYDHNGYVSSYYIRVTPIRSLKLDQSINSLYSYTEDGLYHREEYDIPHRYDLVFRKPKLKLPNWF